jgi:hypothetical protein
MEDRPWTNLPVDTPHGRFMVARAMNDKQTDLRTVIGKTLSVFGLVVYRDYWTSKEDGEEKSSIKVVMVCDDGEPVAFTAVTAGRSLARLLSMCPPGPWDPPLRITVGTRKPNDYKSGFTLTLAEPVAPTSSKPTTKKG